jgi:hypothetical protein
VAHRAIDLVVVQIRAAVVGQQQGVSTFYPRTLGTRIHWKLLPLVVVARSLGATLVESYGEGSVRIHGQAIRLGYQTVWLEKGQAQDA